MTTALILGGNGQTGVPTAGALAREGWAVRVLHRGSRPLAPGLAELGVAEVRGDYADPAGLARAIGDGVDLLVDCVGFDATDAERVLAHSDRLGSAVVLSSAAVYADEAGRTLGSADPPQLPVPIAEDQATVSADLPGYAGGKVGYEHRWLASDVLVTVLRPGAIHGRYARNPREWYVLKRILDGRREVLLAHSGASRFQTTAARTIAELVRLAAGRPGARVLNVADPAALTVAEIVASVGAARGHELTVHRLHGYPEGTLGLTPWSVPTPIVLDMAAAGRDLGYRPVLGYVEALPDYLDWLEEVAAAGEWRTELTEFAAMGAHLFDYAAEDAWLAAQRR
ncbi:NAD(P)-dependent oxidoreductase [Ruania zhangjianzhongii]|uniref:NAD(P)-dependent oxidoreductase n=1 Tax=Ruania zhangjianzhongii TaxID=2603206 RepID=UPI0011CB8071|nr:NAD(P)-dependent oxidoreductase [Ruania zhangjianzhongii]